MSKNGGFEVCVMKFKKKCQKKFMSSISGGNKEGCLAERKKNIFFSFNLMAFAELL
jgi:hypothetical protein